MPSEEQAGKGPHSDNAKPMRFTRLRQWEHLDSKWNQAAMSSPQLDPFCCRTEWQLAYHEAHAPGRELIVRETPGSLVAFTDISEDESGFLYGPAESHWLNGSPLLGPESLELFCDLLADFEPGRDSLSPRFVISGLEPTGKLIRALLASLGKNYRFWLYHSQTLCNASLEGGFDGFLSRRSAKHRSGMNAQARRAAKHGVTFERYTPGDAGAAAQLYARMLAVEELSWKGIERCGMTVEPSRTYYRCMLRRLAISGIGRVMFARRGEQDIGYIFGGLAGEVYRGQQFSFARDWKSFSIGNLLQVELIKWLCEEGIQRYDMGPFMDYKRRWAENNYPITAVVIQHKRSKNLRQLELPL
jgi:hypothetical protein